MEKRIGSILIASFLTIILSACTVNEYTALIRMENMSSNAVTNSEQSKGVSIKVMCLLTIPL